MFGTLKIDGASGVGFCKGHANLWFGRANSMVTVGLARG